MRRLAVALCLSLFACTSPTPVERIAAQHGVEARDIQQLMAQRGLTEDELTTASTAFVHKTLARLREPRPDHAAEAIAWRLLSLQDERGQIPHNADLIAKAQVAAMRREGVGAGFDSANWTELGPGNIGGRVRTIAIHPTQSSTMFCGSVAGGIWRTDNGGQTWAPVDDLMNNLAITSIVFQPGDPQVMYAGTGEGFRNSDAIRGAGIFKSTDGGLTWSQLPATNISKFVFVGRIAISPDGQVLLAGTSVGLYRSLDGGASFVQCNGAPISSKYYYDVKFHPTNSLVAVAQCHNTASAVYHTVDGGANWQPSSLPPSIWGERTELAWHKGYTGAGNGCVYAMQAKNGTTIHRSLDGGATWTQVSTNSILGGQGWYDNALWVDPSDADANPADDVIVAGGLDLWRSTNGGSSFTKISTWSSWPSSAHADHHCIVEHPGFDGVNNKTVYFGNDGGVWCASNVYTVAGTSGWTSLNNSLGITQFYGGSRHAGAGILVGGTQDNGTLRRTDSGGYNGWTTMFGGDGGWCASDPTDSKYHYGEYVFLQIHRSKNSGVSSSYIYSGIADAGVNANFIAPFVLDPNNKNRMLAGGHSLWRSNNVRNTRPTWASIKPPTAGVPTNVPISAIAVAPGNSNVIWVGDNYGNVWSTANGTATSPTWTPRDNGSPALPGRQVTRITLEGNRVLVTFGGYNTDNVWSSTDGGVTWVAATGMPAAPVRDLEVHPSQPGWWYAATEVGFLCSEDGGVSWTSSATPAVASVDEMFWSGGQLYLITHGRGMFRQAPSPSGFADNRGEPCRLNGLAVGPALDSDVPVLGRSMRFTLSGAAPNALGALFVSRVPQSPIQLSSGCFLQVDPESLLQLASCSIPGGGTCNIPVHVPDDPSLTGTRVMTQAAVVDRATVDLSNGRELTLVR